MNIHCLKNLCDNNTGFTQECMFAITEDVIRKAKEEKSSMCPFLRKEVLKIYKEIANVIVDDIVDSLEKELKLADEEKRRCVNENALQFDSAKGYATGVYNSIEIVKEVVGGN